MVLLSSTYLQILLKLFAFNLSQDLPPVLVDFSKIKSCECLFMFQFILYLREEKGVYIIL